MADLLQSAKDIIGRAPGRACFTCSFQAEDVAVLHLLLRKDPRIPVLFLETGYHFPETYAYRDQLAHDWNLNLVNMQAAQTVAEQESAFGILHQTDPSRCCHLRKVEPLLEGLSGYETWFTGLRREQSPSRANLQPEESHRFPNGLTLHKVSPLYDWKWQDVLAYLAANDVPLLPLYEQGYTSIGCAPCTAKAAPGEHARAGRWGGQKLECGLHTVSEKAG